MKLALNKLSLKTVLIGSLFPLFLVPVSSMAGGLMPFILGSNSTESSVEKAVAKASTSLEENGFEIVGSYSPSANKTVVVVSNAHLKKLAGMSKNGGFGAMQRVAISQKGAQVEVSYTNPTYQWNAYRMQGDIKPVQNAIEKALGKQSSFGADEGLSASDLRKYHYKMMMPYFDDEDELAEYGSYQEAVKAVEAGLKAKRAGSQKVYRIDIPGKEMSVFGVALTHQEGADKYIVKEIDGKAHSHSAHFPYEILVAGDEVLALNAKFRIAINWPSLSMMGSGSFMSIAGAPDNIKEALEAVATNQKLEQESDGYL